MQINRLRVLAIFFSLITGAFATSLDNETRMVLKAVSERYRALGSWESTFTQETFSPGLGAGTFNEGRLYFIAPDKFRYSLVRPEMSDFIGDGKSAWYIQYKAGRSKPAHVRYWPSTKGLELDRYLVLLRGIDASTPEKEATLLKDFNVKGKSSTLEISLDLEPKNSTEIAHIILSFKSDDKMPGVIVIEDLVGSRSTVRMMSSKQVSGKVSPDVFKPDYPKGSKIETIK